MLERGPKATVILKDKMNCIIGNETPDDAIYQRVTAWPELWDDQEIAVTYKKAEVNDRHSPRGKEEGAPSDASSTLGREESKVCLSKR